MVYFSFFDISRIGDGFWFVLDLRFLNFTFLPFLWVAAFRRFFIIAGVV